MRISVDKNDPGFRPDWPLAEVFLNGEKIRNCVTADSYAGTALCYRVDKHGHIMHRDGNILTEIKRGNVCIVINDR